MSYPCRRQSLADGFDGAVEECVHFLLECFHLGELVRRQDGAEFAMQFGAFNRAVRLNRRQIGRRNAHGVFRHVVLLNCAAKLSVRVVQTLEQTGEGVFFCA